MDKLTVTLKILTPLFLGGAEPRDKPPEMRVPSLRGALRYWYRAVIGGTIDGSSPEKFLKALYDSESEVFGNTKQASSVIIRARWLNGEPKSEPFNRREFGQDRIDPTEKCQTSGKNYLYWSMGPLGGSARKYYLPDQEKPLELTLEKRIGVTDGEQKLLEAGFALWLLCHLGGIGSRARRTAGSLQVNQASSLEGMPSFDAPATVEGLVTHLQSGIQEIRKYFGKSTPTSSLQYDVLSSSTCKIWIIRGEQPWDNWKPAVETIGSYLCGFRNKRPTDYLDVLNWINGKSTPNTVQRAVFGLPLPFRYSNGTTGTVVGTIHEDRRASPLHLRIYQLSGGEHVCIATLFMTEFLDRDERGNTEKLKLQKKNRTPVSGPSDYQLIEDFIQSISPTPIEVTL